MMTDAFFADRGVRRGEYYLMTCHRRENVEQRGTLEAILRLVEEAPHRVYFPASYRTQQRLRDFGLALPPNVNVVDPIGDEEMLCLMATGDLSRHRPEHYHVPIDRSYRGDGLDT